MARNELVYVGRVTRRGRRFQVRAWRVSNKYASGPFTYHRTRLVARIIATVLGLLGYRVELWDREAH
jgi:acyl-coenzyme A thioesterase PaaI-like protein